MKEQHYKPERIIPLMKFLVLDCEACNCPKIDGQLDAKNGQAYDLGGQVIDEFGAVYEKFSCIIEDVFFGMPQAMEEAFYAEKIPQYFEDMRMNRREIINIWNAYHLVRELCKKWNVQAVVANNARFDVAVLNSTLRYQTKSRKRYFLPYGMKVLDSMKIAKMVLSNSPEYEAFCKEHNFMTNHSTPRPRFTAEVLWRYFTQNVDFEEKHTGFEDVEIESQIMAKCLEALRIKASGLVPASHLVYRIQI